MQEFFPVLHTAALFSGISDTELAGCMIQNFGEYDKNRVTIVRDICATAKG